MKGATTVHLTAHLADVMVAESFRAQRRGEDGVIESDGITYVPGRGFFKGDRGDADSGSAQIKIGESSSAPLPVKNLIDMSAAERAASDALVLLTESTPVEPEPPPAPEAPPPMAEPSASAAASAAAEESQKPRRAPRKGKAESGP